MDVADVAGEKEVAVLDDAGAETLHVAGLMGAGGAAVGEPEPLLGVVDHQPAAERTAEAEIALRGGERLVGAAGMEGPQLMDLERQALVVVDQRAGQRADQAQRRPFGKEGSRRVPATVPSTDTTSREG